MTRKGQTELPPRVDPPPPPPKRGDPAIGPRILAGLAGASAARRRGAAGLLVRAVRPAAGPSKKALPSPAGASARPRCGRGGAGRLRGAGSPRAYVQIVCLHHKRTTSRRKNNACT